MTSTYRTPSSIRWLAGGVGLAAASYAAYAGAAWLRYGRPPQPTDDERDSLLDRFMPVHDVVDRQHVCINAPADITLAAAREMELFRPPVARIVFRARELVLGASPDRRERPVGLLEEALSLGWGVLAEVPAREVVVGAVTKPWESNVIFTAVRPDEFLAFRDPGYVKIAWSLRADSIGARESIFRTETRAVATDATAGARFRRYWAWASPGIWMIRRASLSPLKREAERRVREAIHEHPEPQHAG
jgi:hypothetical protein